MFFPTNGILVYRRLNQSFKVNVCSLQFLPQFLIASSITILRIHFLFSSKYSCTNGMDLFTVLAVKTSCREDTRG